MTGPERYASAAAVESAIRDAARRAAAADPTLTVQERIRQEHFRRFLSRVFSEDDDSDWLLKGGTGMLARVGSARSTTDVDLFRANRSLDVALTDLKRLAAVDLGDFFTFEFLKSEPVVAGDQQTYTEGYGVDFAVFIGASRKEPIHIDLVVGVVVTGEVTVREPANALALPKLPSHDYRLYPVVDQVADKICATMALYSGRPSSREKDLVDLVLIAVTEDLDAGAVAKAVDSERRVRSLDAFSTFVIPEAWGARYAKAAKPIPLLADYRSVKEAGELMRSFIDPILIGDAVGKAWSHDQRAWI